MKPLAQLRTRWRSFIAEADATRTSSAEIWRLIGAQPIQGGAEATALPKLAWPVHGRVTSRFEMRHGRLHEGIDMSAPRGTPVHAALPGVVAYCGELPSYGNVVVVHHGGNYATVYAHLDRIEVALHDRVACEQRVGTVGISGRSFGAHLHFEVRFDGTPVDPLVLLSREAR